uniref:Uncharacterized protein n=1 Tax=Siphoviridae sp. ct2D011 TaxID=2825314 RepID=A0A8S5V919_9CAUD|nr:MAG TPA: hypothetical protein [Siphoviridae sp. ct2D011]
MNRDMPPEELKYILQSYFLFPNSFEQQFFVLLSLFYLLFYEQLYFFCLYYTTNCLP